MALGDTNILIHVIPFSSWCLSQSHWFFSEVWFNCLVLKFPHIPTTFCLDFSFLFFRLFKNHSPSVFPGTKWLPFIDVLHSSLISPISKPLNFWLFDSTSFHLCHYKRTYFIAKPSLASKWPGYINENIKERQFLQPFLVKVSVRYTLLGYLYTFICCNWIFIIHSQMSM